jgi:hypothetical protein
MPGTGFVVKKRLNKIRNTVRLIFSEELDVLIAYVMANSSR